MKLFKEVLLTVVGMASATLGLEGFLLPNGFIDGGITGLSMLVSQVFELNLAVVLIIINTPFLILGLLKVGKRFFGYTVFGILGLSIMVYFVHLPTLTDDKLLSAVFGGLFLGGGIGFAIRGSSVLDGTEIFALLLYRRVGVKVGDVLLVLNVVLFLSSIFILGLESVLYSILTYISATKTIDFIIYGVEAYHGAYIVSARSAEVRGAILKQMDRGVTVLRGEGGFMKAERDVLLCVVTRLETSTLKKLVAEIDPHAFIIFQHVSEVVGGRVKKILNH